MNILYCKFRYIRIFYILILLLLNNNLFGQVQQNDKLYIGNSSYVAVNNGFFNFGPTTAITQTSRTSNTYGRLIFGPSVSWSGASFNHYVDGYASSLGNSSFIFPVGDDSVYAPVKIGAANTSVVYNCAYNLINPSSIGPIDGSTINLLSNVGYWNLYSSSSAKLSLSWDSYVNLAALLPGLSINDITIAGFNGTHWEQIPSTVDVTDFLGNVSSLTLGSISSDFPVNFVTYSSFTLAVKGTCKPLVSSSGNTKTWNGSWIPSAPTLEDLVVINSPYNAGSFSCNSLILNHDITLNSNEFIEVINGVSGTGKIIMSSSSSFVQRANSVSAPLIQMTKTREGLRRYDYVYYGTPIVGDFFSNFATAQASTASTANAFDLFYKYNSGTGGGWQATSSTETGKGLIARVKQAPPFIDASTTDNVSVVFNGIANNGDITITATNNPSQLNGGTSHALLGNPYPSAIDGDLFLKENTDIDGVLYLWTSATSYPGSGNYNQSDYLAYTLAGTVLPGAINSNFDGKISSGQGFKVKLLPDADNPTTVAKTANITFTNCMRVKGNNASFFKYNSTDNVVEKDRFKITMTGNNGVYSQILVAYLPEATLGYDRLYDAGRNSVSTAQFYSIFEGDGRKLAINARPSFFITDKVPVGFSKNDNVYETFTFTVSDKEGVFNNTSIYLHDKINNTYHDFNNGSFTYYTNESITNDRFEIVYQNNLLSSNDFIIANANILLANNQINVKSTNDIDAIFVYDLTGRVVEKYHAINSNSLISSFNHEESIYIVKVIYTDGSISNVKAINIK